VTSRGCGSPASAAREIRQAERLAQEARRVFIRSPPLLWGILNGISSGGRWSPGQLVGRYTLLTRLDVGGQGEVWDANSAAGPVALKLLHPEQTGAHGEALGRFRRELAAAQAVRSTCVARPLDWDVDGELAWIAYERIVGVPLNTYVREQEVQAPLAEALRILADVAEGLLAVHGCGLTHCDVKPANVMVRPRGGGAVLLDLGAVSFGNDSTWTRAGWGTDGWRAPEQSLGQTTTASDMYAFGLLSIKVLTGHLAYAGEFRFGEDPDLRGLPAAVAGLVLECLDNRAAQRPTAGQATSRLTEELDKLDTDVAKAQEAAAAEAMREAQRAQEQARRGWPGPAVRPSTGANSSWQRGWPVQTRLLGVTFHCGGSRGHIQSTPHIEPTPLWGQVLQRAMLFSYPHFYDGRHTPLRLGDWYKVSGRTVVASDGSPRLHAFLSTAPPLTPFGRASGEEVALPRDCPDCGRRLERRVDPPFSTKAASRARRGQPLPVVENLVCPAHATCPPQLFWHVYQLAESLLGVTQPQPFRLYQDLRGLLTAAKVVALPDVFQPGLPNVLRRVSGDAGNLLAQALDSARTVPDLVLLEGLGLPRAAVQDPAPHVGLGFDTRVPETLTDALEAWNLADLPRPDLNWYMGHWPDEEVDFYRWVVEDGGWRRETLEAALALRNGPPDTLASGDFPPRGSARG